MAEPKDGETHPQGNLTHLDADGAPRMVDVSAKAVTTRTAVAEGAIRMAPGTLDELRQGATAKGNVLEVARLAGIMGGKRTGELIPLCHLLPGVSVEIDAEVNDMLPGVRIRAAARLAGQTGVEMEALTAVSVALLTVYDMLKAVDRSMVLEGIRLLEKSGGRSGEWSAEEDG